MNQNCLTGNEWEVDMQYKKKRYEGCGRTFFNIKGINI